MISAQHLLRNTAYRGLVRSSGASASVGNRTTNATHVAFRSLATTPRSAATKNPDVDDDNILPVRIVLLCREQASMPSHSLPCAMASTRFFSHRILFLSDPFCSPSVFCLPCCSITAFGLALPRLCCFSRRKPQPHHRPHGKPSLTGPPRFSF